MRDGFAERELIDALETRYDVVVEPTGDSVTVTLYASDFEWMLTVIDKGRRMTNRPHVWEETPA